MFIHIPFYIYVYTYVCGHIAMHYVRFNWHATSGSGETVAAQAIGRWTLSLFLFIYIYMCVCVCVGGC